MDFNFPSPPPSLPSLSYPPGYPDLFVRGRHAKITQIPPPKTEPLEFDATLGMINFMKVHYHLHPELVQEKKYFAQHTVPNLIRRQRGDGDAGHGQRGRPDGEGA